MSFRVCFVVSPSSNGCDSATLNKQTKNQFSKQQQQQHPKPIKRIISGRELTLLPAATLGTVGLEPHGGSTRELTRLTGHR